MNIGRRGIRPAVILGFAAFFTIAGCGRQYPSASIGSGSESAFSPTSLQLVPDDAGRLPAYRRYAATVTLHIGFKVPDAKLPPGDSNDDNPISRYFEKLTNIHVEHSWEARGDDAFRQKVDLAIASNDLPDAMVVDGNQLRTLVKSGKVADLTGIYKKYASKLVRSIYDSTNGLALRDATFGGKLYGLPNVALEADSPTLLWVRQDWMDKLHLPPPKKLGDIATIARAFISQDPDGDHKNDTVGISGTKGIVYGEKPLYNGFDSIFNAFHAFPKNWIRDADGRIVYGSLTPQTKQALALLADWYKQGIIDKNFALYKDSEEPIVQNKTGIFFGPWWMPYYPLDLSVEKDTKAEWRAYAAPLDEEGRFVTHMAPVTDRYLVVRKGYKHPEAALKLLNVFTRLERNRDPHTAAVKQLKAYALKSNIQLRNYYPFDLLLDYSDSVEKSYRKVQKALKGETDPDTLDPDSKNIYKSIVAERENPKKNMENWKSAAAYEYGAGVLVHTKMKRVYSVFYGTTPTMEAKWPSLQRLENDTFLKIIVGDEPIGAFDDFVRKWNQMGGAQITKEVADIVNSRQ